MAAIISASLPNILSTSASKFRMFSLHFSVFSSYHSGLGGGLLALNSMLLIFGDTAPTASAVSSLRSGNLSGKRRRESKVDGDLAVGWLRGRSTVLKMAAVKRCDAEGERAGPTPPHRRPGLSEDFVTCVRYSWSSE